MSRIANGGLQKICSLAPGGTPKKWEEECGPLTKTLTLFMTKICDFPYPVYNLSMN